MRKRLVVGDTLLMVDAAIQSDVDGEREKAHTTTLSRSITDVTGPEQCRAMARRCANKNDAPPQMGGASIQLTQQGARFSAR
jgi:hypothetical protein